MTWELHLDDSQLELRQCKIFSQPTGMASQLHDSDSSFGAVKCSYSPRCGVEHSNHQKHHFPGHFFVFADNGSLTPFPQTTRERGGAHAPAAGSTYVDGSGMTRRRSSLTRPSLIDKRRKSACHGEREPGGARAHVQAEKRRGTRACAPRRVSVAECPTCTRCAHAPVSQRGGRQRLHKPARLHLKPRKFQGQSSAQPPGHVGETRRSNMLTTASRRFVIPH